MSSGLGAMLDKAAGPITGKFAGARLAPAGAPTTPTAGRAGFMALLTALESPMQAPAAGPNGLAARDASLEPVQGLPVAPVPGMMAPVTKQTPAVTAGDLPQATRTLAEETEPHNADLALFLQQSGTTIFGMSPADSVVQADLVTQDPDQDPLPAGVPPGQENLLFGQSNASMSVAFSSAQQEPPVQAWARAPVQSLPQPQPSSTVADQPSSGIDSEAYTGLDTSDYVVGPAMPSPRDVARPPVSGEKSVHPTGIEPGLSRPTDGLSFPSLSVRSSQPDPVNAEGSDKSTTMRPLPDPKELPWTGAQPVPQVMAQIPESSDRVASPPVGSVGQVAIPSRAAAGLDRALPLVNLGALAGESQATRVSGLAEPLSQANAPADLATVAAHAENAAPTLAPRRSSAEATFGVEPGGVFRTLEPASQEASSSRGQSDDQGRPADTAPRRPDPTPASRAAELPWVQATGNAELRYAEPSPVSSVMAASPEAAIAETVTYWAAQGIQNAELKLDAWGGQALEVSISMNGNQAEVEFRTDQSEIRQIIEGAMPQLKDMLAEEGLILSGVAVGASGNQSSDTPGRRPPQGSRQLRVSQAEDEVATVHRRSGSGVGQALDLFV